MTHPLASFFRVTKQLIDATLYFCIVSIEWRYLAETLARRLTEQVVRMPLPVSAEPLLTITYSSAQYHSIRTIFKNDTISHVNDSSKHVVVVIVLLPSPSKPKGSY
jgi:hypothetical protein